MRTDLDGVQTAVLGVLTVVGAGAANQAVKSIAIARSYMALVGVDLICIPAFTTVEIDGDERTAMKFIVEPR